MQKFFKSLIVLTATLALITTVATPAHAARASEQVTRAAVTSDASPDSLSAAVIEEAYQDLLRSDVPRVTSGPDGDGIVRTTFTLPGGREMTFDRSEVGALLGGGWDGAHGLYVEFNRTDQGVIAGGGGAALATALCLIPGVGPALCIVAVAIVGAAAAGLAAHGMCGNIMRIYAQLLGYPECR
jgi:hypothetical protein